MRPNVKSKLDHYRMTRLVAIGDIHLHPGAKNAQKLQLLDMIITEASTVDGLGAWLLLGDLFHARSSVEDRNALAARLQRMADRAPVLIVRGNHDGLGELQIFAELRAEWPIYVLERPECLGFRTATMDDVTVFGLPYPERAGLVLAGVANPDLVDEAAHALDAIFMQAAIELEDARAKGDMTLMVGHANITGAIASNAQPQVGREISVMPQHLDRLGPIAKVFGHIHKPQELHGAVYAGSISRGSFGEIEAKRYLVVDLHDDSTFTIADRPIDCPPMAHIEGELTRDGFTWQMTAGPGGELQDPPTSWKGWEVRCRYRFAQSEAAVVEKARVLAEFAEAALLVLDPIAVPDRALRAPEVAAAKTLPDKVAAWCAISGAVASEGVLFKLGKLEQMAPEVVLDATKDHVSDIVEEELAVPA